MQATQLPGRSREGIPDVWCLGGIPESSLVASAVSERTGNVTQKALPCRSSRRPCRPAAGRDSRRSPERPRRAVASSNLALWKTARPACPLSPALGRAVVVPSLTRHGRTRTGQMAGSPRARPAARTARTARTSPCRCAARAAAGRPAPRPAGGARSHVLLCLFKNNYPEEHLKKRHFLLKNKVLGKTQMAASLSHAPGSRLPQSHQEFK